MAVGTLVYSNGLKGTQPIHISNGGSTATFIGEPDINPIKLPLKVLYCGQTVGLSTRFGTSNTLSAIKYPTDFILTSSLGPYPTNPKVSLNLTIDGRTLALTGFQGGNYYTYFKPLHFLAECTSDTSISAGVPITDMGNHITDYSILEIPHHPKKNISTQNGFTIKYSNSDYPSPSTNFNTWGTEISGGDYTNLESSYNSNYYNVGSDYLVAEITGLTTYEKIFPIITHEGTSTVARIWNYNSSRWETFVENVTLGGTIVMGNINCFPYGNIFNSENYIYDGKAYLKVINGQKIGFIGLYQYNTRRNA